MSTFTKTYEPARLVVDKLCCVKQPCKASLTHSKHICALFVAVVAVGKEIWLLLEGQDLRKFGLLRSRGSTKTKTVMT